MDGGRCQGVTIGWSKGCDSHMQGMVLLRPEQMVRSLLPLISVPRFRLPGTVVVVLQTATLDDGVLLRCLEVHHDQRGMGNPLETRNSSSVACSTPDGSQALGCFVLECIDSD